MILWQHIKDIVKMFCAEFDCDILRNNKLLPIYNTKKIEAK